MTNETHDRIKQLIDSHDILLFMKGVPTLPLCGFSVAVVQVLGDLGVKYSSVNVLDDGAIREGIEAFSSWPTIPQLYVKGEFVGGCDIVREMYESGELASLLAAKSIPAAATATAITAPASNA